MKIRKIAEGKFKSSHYLIYKDYRGIHKALFSSKRMANLWLRRKRR